MQLKTDQYVLTKEMQPAADKLRSPSDSEGRSLSPQQHSVRTLTGNSAVTSCPEKLKKQFHFFYMLPEGPAMAQTYK